MCWSLKDELFRLRGLSTAIFPLNYNSPSPFTSQKHHWDYPTNSQVQLSAASSAQAPFKLVYISMHITSHQPSPTGMLRIHFLKPRLKITRSTDSSDHPPGCRVLSTRVPSSASQFIITSFCSRWGRGSTEQLSPETQWVRDGASVSGSCCPSPCSTTRCLCWKAHSDPPVIRLGEIKGDSYTKWNEKRG